MGNLAEDTAVTQVGEGEYTARIHPDWEIWGPMGGYVASVALRAAGAASPFARPASFSCHYLGVARFDEVQLTVRTLRQARTALSQRVEMRQGDRPVLEATVWSVGDVDGLAHDVAEAPDVPPPHELPGIDELLAGVDTSDRPQFPFWGNFESRPIGWWVEPPTEPQPPVYRG